MSDSAGGDRVEVLAETVAGFDDLNSLIELANGAAEAALDAEHLTGPDALTVLLSDDQKLRDLNRQFNGEDSVTDVLSFNDVEGWHNGVPPSGSDEGEFSMPGEQQRLGEIVISLEQTKRQADERSVSFDRELAMLTVHGILHLLGYDHADAAEEAVMFGKTDAVLERLFG